MTNAREKTQQELAAEAEANEPREAKVARVLAAYAHDLAHGAPRTAAELATLKALLEG